MIELFCGLGERTWNTVPVPDTAGPFMVAANCSKPVNPGSALVMSDSGAFGDKDRLDPAAALARQLAHETKSGYTAHSLVAYDLLIDEKWDSSGKRHKCRWEEDEAWTAVEETIAACGFLADTDIGERRRVLPIQGVTPRQQEYCADAILPMLGEGDILGMGGWCIIGWAPPGTHTRTSLEAAFWDSAWRIIPKAGIAGVGQVHIFGVMVADILGGLLWLCDQNGIGLASTDSSGPQKRPAANGRWGYADWASKCFFPAGVERGNARVRHVREVRNWLENFRDTQYYKCPPRGE